MSKLLGRLTRFYKDEAARLPHKPADLFELAWDLADLMEDYGCANEIDCIALRRQHNVTLIDTAVNILHQHLLDAENEDTGAMMNYLEGDLVRYLLERENNNFWDEAEAWCEKENERQAVEMKLEFD